MLARFLLPAALLAAPAAACAQGSVAKCTADPKFVGCYPTASSPMRGNVLLGSQGDAVRTFTVAQILQLLQLNDITTALGYTPVNPASLSTVATSGAYGDLTGKPTLPAPGTTAGTYAAGNDARITGAYPASNPSGFQTAAQVTAAIPTAGTGASNYAAGNDSRITGALSSSAAASTYAPLASPALTGTPTVPTASAGTSTTQAASTAFAVTAATNAAAARAEQGANASITSLSGLTTPLSAAQGGTGGTGGAWTSTNVAVSTGSGTLTSATGTMRYLKIGRTVQFTLTVAITTNGSGATFVQATLPNSWTPAATFAGAGVNTASAGTSLQWTLPNTTFAIFTASRTYPGADGANLVISGVFETTS